MCIVMQHQPLKTIQLIYFKCICNTYGITYYTIIFIYFLTEFLIIFKGNVENPWFFIDFSTFDNYNSTLTKAKH